MLYSGDNPVLRLVGVEHIDHPGGTFKVEPREYSALAFRIRGSTVIHSGENTYYIEPGDILYLPQNMGYTASYTGTEMMVIHFVTARDDGEIEVYKLHNTEKIYKMFLQAHSLWENREPGFTVYIISALYAILGTVLEKETRTALPEYFLRAVSFINSNYKDNGICVDMICEEAGISATVFRRLFKEHYQKTPTEYITELRLEYARNLISGGASVENAAILSGFNDPKYFARVVKKRFGCTPRAFREYGK